MHKDAEAECERMLAQAREEAAAIKANAKRNQGDYDSVVEAPFTDEKWLVSE